MEEQYKELIQQGDNGQIQSFLLFRVKGLNQLFSYYVKFTENTEAIIEKYTSDQTYEGKNLGVMYELLYQHDYEFKDMIPFEKIYDIKKDMIGYVDKEGNFYPISKVEEHYYRRSGKGLIAGIKAINIVLSSNISKEEKEKYKKERKKEFYEMSFGPWNWSADKILKENGYCLFFRGIDDEGIYVDYSYYDNATEKQLIVMNLLFNLNHTHSTEIEKERKRLVKRYIEGFKNK